MVLHPVNLEIEDCLHAATSPRMVRSLLSPAPLVRGLPILFLVVGRETAESGFENHDLRY